MQADLLDENLKHTSVRFKNTIHTKATQKTSSRPKIQTNLVMGALKKIGINWRMLSLRNLSFGVTCSSLKMSTMQPSSTLSYSLPVLSFAMKLLVLGRSGLSARGTAMRQVAPQPGPTAGWGAKEHINPA